MLPVRRALLNRRYDLAVLGSGFAGSILAMIGVRLGLSVILLEKGSHPRFAIGESSTPLSNLLLEEIAERYNLPALKALSKWGTWQRTYPNLACGLKRGFTFFHHDLHNPHPNPLPQLLVEASPSDTIADTHWYRADFDAFLVEEAKSAGATFLDRVQIEHVSDGDDEVQLQGQHGDKPFQLSAGFVVDATGPRGVLHQRLRLPEVPLPSYPATEALFGHFTDVNRLDQLPHATRSSSSAYPTDDAAVHHVFDGGWIWVLRFNNGITSAGVAAEQGCAHRLGLARGLPAWQDLIRKIPVLSEQFAHAAPQQPLLHTPQLSFRSATVAGKRWALLPSAAGFVDPLLSTGFPLTLLGVTRLAEILENHGTQPDLSAKLDSYASRTTEELLATARLIGALYANMGEFEIFRSLTLLYFAAASFSESARRLGRRDLAPSFLLHNKPGFGEQCRSLLLRLAQDKRKLTSDAIATEVRQMIQPIDVAGLTKQPKDHFYPVLAEDLIQTAWKLGSSPQDAIQMLQRSGFVITSPDEVRQA